METESGITHKYLEDLGYKSFLLDNDYENTFNKKDITIYYNFKTGKISITLDSKENILFEGLINTKKDLQAILKCLKLKRHFHSPFENNINLLKIVSELRLSCFMDDGVYNIYNRTFSIKHNPKEKSVYHMGLSSQDKYFTFYIHSHNEMISMLNVFDVISTSYLLEEENNYILYRCKTTRRNKLLNIN